MAEKSALGKVLSFVAWLTGIIVALSVGFALIDGPLGLPNWLGGGLGIPMIAGYIVVIATILSVILAIADSFSA